MEAPETCLGVVQSMSKRYFCYELACDIGLDESAILSQFYYWLSTYAKHPDKHQDNFQDNQWWVFNSLRTWHKKQFGYMSFSKFSDPREEKKGKLEKLRDMGYLVKSTKDYNKKFKGKKSTSWYTINLAKLHADYPYTVKEFPDLPMPKHLGSLESPDNSCSENPDTAIRKFQTGCMEIPDSSCMEIPDNNTYYYLPKNITNTTNLNDDEGNRILDLLGKFFSEYEARRGEKHPILSEYAANKAITNIKESGIYKYNPTEILNDYFGTEFKSGCNYRLSHFTSPGILKYRVKAIEKEQTENTISRNWRQSLKYLRIDDIDDCMYFYLPAKRNGLDLRQLSDSEYEAYIADESHSVKPDYSNDGDFIFKCQEELRQVVYKRSDPDESLSDEPHIKPETHVLHEYQDCEWNYYGDEEELPFD